VLRSHYAQTEEDPQNIEVTSRGDGLVRTAPSPVSPRKKTLKDRKIADLVRKTILVFTGKLRKKGG
jgi:hypothetical protein